jgi:hypothetical protein
VPRVVAAVLLSVSLAAAISVDVVKTGFGVKGDEATYVAMALSVAYDHDLAYSRPDVERFWGLYRAGPDGIFLKRGKQWHVRLRGAPPYVHISRVADPGTSRLYFGKALMYSVAAAPFVRAFGLNGFLVFHVLLLFGVSVCGYRFLAARARPGPALAFTLAFLGATVVPVYAVLLTSDLFNFALVFFAYFLWLYKEVAPPERHRFLGSFASDLCAAVLLGVATYSKLFNAPLVAPLVLMHWWRRRIWSGVIAGAVFAVVALGLFGMNAAISGEFNHQGGDRRIFYARFPFDSPEDTWDRLASQRDHSVEMVTNDSDAANVLQPSELANRFGHNVEYFFIGRHFGFIPYFFPGVVALGLWLASRDRFEPWRVLVFLALAASTIGILLFLPYSWSGGGGPTGNRYFLNLYPALFFLTPSVTIAPALLAWAVGALFTAKMLVNPFAAAKFPNQITERGFARRLPVEITMANDLPVMLEGPRAHSWYSDVLLYFLDEHAYNPETIDPDGHQGVWIAGDGRADIVMRCEWPIDHLRMTVESPIRTVFVVSAGGGESRIPLLPGQAVTFNLAASGVRDLNSFAYLLSARSTEGFTPHLRDPKSTDYRNLGVLMRFTPVPAAR